MSVTNDSAPSSVRRPWATTLSELRAKILSYAPGWEGYKGRGKVSVAGLSEIMRWFPELNATFLPEIVPHVAEKIESLTEYWSAPPQPAPPALLHCDDRYGLERVRALTCNKTRLS